MSVSVERAALRESLRRQLPRTRWRWIEFLFFIVLAAASFLLPTHLVLLAQIMIAGLFALSLDVLLGYTGIVSAGHAAFFGLGAYTAGLLLKGGWTEPLSGLVGAGIVAGAFGFLCSLLLARLRGIALLTVTMGIGLLLYEVANRADSITGGDDGLQGIVPAPLLGLFEWDFYGRTAFWYCFAVLLVLYAMLHRMMQSPFGLSLRAIRENTRRVPALGISAGGRIMAAFTLSAMLAGIAGGLLAQTTQFVALEAFSFERSTAALVMVIFGGAGSLIGALLGAVAYLVAQSELSAISPTYWYFWLGLILVGIVLFGRGGIIGWINRAEYALLRNRRRK